ncbi:MbtH family protein [Kitasatospora sp. NPDC058170]|uniref:MbtH family protein n=1 Tax=Kitasatospora sp. NPDC058170 TaxID=3346364 RepID=UPI0036DDF2DA
MTNPFDTADAAFSVLENAAGQFSLWPATAEVPAGWTAVHGPSDRDTALGYVNEHWTDLRPGGRAGRRPRQPDN